MATETFTWRAVNTAAGQVTLRTLSAQFGDGYSQAAGDGLNNKVQSWPLQFAGRQAEILAIQDFLDRHKGYKSFYWTPPLGVQGLYRVPEYSPVADKGGIYTLSATFVQSFAP
jgi:phage-related protein